MASFWENRESWPRAPREFVFLAFAFDEVGAAMYGTEWTGEEALPVQTPAGDALRNVETFTKSRPSPAISISRRAPIAVKANPETEALLARRRAQHSAHVGAYRLEQMRRAVDAEAEANGVILARRFAVAEWIADAARNADLDSFGRMVTGGAVFPIPAHTWNVEPVWKLFHDCRTGPVYLFVGRDSLDRCLSAIKSSTGALSRAGAQGQTERWLRAEFAKPETAGTSKGQFKSEAQNLFEGLSGEAFDRAWGNATEDFPERRGAGRKSGEKSGGKSPGNQEA